ncbi:MAG: protein kinase domain-containing protein [Planctomycetota bacterium]
MQIERKTEEAIFKAAIQLKAQAEREAYILEACEDDQELLEKVRVLLKYHESNSFLDAPIFEPDIILDESPLTEGPGTVIGRYKLLEKIGEGGMAVVYMAEQEKPIRRKVALKIIKLGMDTRQVIARFEAERQALAMMEHPNIAKVLDAGATETGRPYFVMELVKGVSITEYCDDNQLSTRERLDLFIQVCSAVQHAHQKGIIHRDIKPSNVMVTQRDGSPVPKVIDFGIAKATSRRLTEKTLFTRYAHIIGTPAYMSPEQAELSELDVDTRTDIYSLGVLLYELLTGTPPFSKDELHKAGYLEMQRIIREEEPIKPSTKLSTFGETLTDIAKHRGSTPDLLRKAIRGDLDWIVMKTLEKDRVRRYDSANALGADVQRHIDHEPVQARAPKAMYRLQKLALRHKSQVAVALVIAILVSALAITFSMWHLSRVQRRKNREFEHNRMLSEAEGFFSNGDALAALQRVEPILDSMYVGAKAKLLYARILVEGQQSARAISQLGGLLHGDPEVAGAAGSLMAWVLWEDEPGDSEELGKRYEYRLKAQEMLEDLRDEAPETAGHASLLLARMVLEEGSIDEQRQRRIHELEQQAKELLPKSAEACFFRATMALSIKEKLDLLGEALRIDPGHYDSLKLRALIYCASRKYESMKDEARIMIAVRQQDPLGYSLRAAALRKLGDYEGAIYDYGEALVRTPKEDLQRAKLYDQRCEIYLHMGDYENVFADANEGLVLFPNETVLDCRVFCALTASGKYKEAIALHRKIVASDSASENRFRDLSMKYVFDSIEAGRSWHLPDLKPEGDAFLAMLEAEEIYHSLGEKGKPLIADAFAADWSSEGTKVVFCVGTPGNSGIATFDLATKETELLIAPGKNPKWSPNGQYIAFIRDRRILPLSQLVANERLTRPPSSWKSELWIMNEDGTEPRPLAHGHWPSWSQDSKHLYIRSSTDGMLYLIDVEDRDEEPQPIKSLPVSHCSVSPDEKYGAYSGGGRLIIGDLTLKSLVVDWRAPLKLWGGNWAPNGHEFSMGGYLRFEDRTGLWIYDLSSGQASQVLCGQVTNAAWAPDGTRLSFSLGPPFYEIWQADLDPNLSTVEALGPGRTTEQYCLERIEHYTKIIAAGSKDPNDYLRRAEYYLYLQDEEKANADMMTYSATQNPQKGMSGNNGLLEPGGSQEPHVSLVFGPAVNLGPIVNSSDYDWGPSISADGRQLYFDSRRSGDWDIWVSTRATTEDDWGPAANLGSEVNGPYWDQSPCISADGLKLFFSSLRSGNWDMWVTMRATVDAPWGNPESLGPIVNSSSLDIAPCISRDGLSLFFGSERPGGYGSADLWLTTRETIDDDWGKPVNLEFPVNSVLNEGVPRISADGLLLFFSGAAYGPFRSNGHGYADLWVTTRATPSGTWSKPVNLGPNVNSPDYDVTPSISTDGSMLYFASNRGGERFEDFDLWQVPITYVSRSAHQEGAIKVSPE